MPRQLRGNKVISYVEDRFYELAVQIANEQDQSLSDYIRDLIVKDLHEKDKITNEDFAIVVYNSLNSRLDVDVAAG